jgi:hypothetical protein
MAEIVNYSTPQKYGIYINAQNAAMVKDQKSV